MTHNNPMHYNALQSDRHPKSAPFRGAFTPHKLLTHMCLCHQAV